MHAQLGAHLCRFGPRAHVWITATQFRDVDWLHPKVVSRITSSPQSDGRGTQDIIWGCRTTIFLCSWSMLCMNIPGPKESRKQRLWRKPCLTALGVLCPESSLGFAFAQWLSARRSVVDMNSLGSRDRFAADRWHSARRIRSKLDLETRAEARRAMDHQRRGHGWLRISHTGSIAIPNRRETVPLSRFEAVSVAAKPRRSSDRGREQIRRSSPNHKTPPDHMICNQYHRSLGTAAGGDHF